MLRIIVYAIYLAVCGGAIATYVQSDAQIPSIIEDNPLSAFFVLLAITQAVALVDLLIHRKRIEVISAIYFGLLVGVLLGYLFWLAVEPVIPIRYEGGARIITFLMFSYISVSLLLQTRDDFRFVIPYIEFSKEMKGGKPLILDSSALIDGRIADVVETGILDTAIIVPEFILLEVQDVADSNDKMRRTRGRRGLEVLEKLQASEHADVRVLETKREDFKSKSVDQKLVELAKRLDGRVITSDYNLNKVASVQGLAVINLNDVANSLKPRYLPGERLNLKISKQGESHGQGVGYLDDGTMVVCEQASHLIGNTIGVIVTSTLQSSAGRMIFVRQVHSTSESGEAE
jgi:uncharacterized protein YacL